MKRVITIVLTAMLVSSCGFIRTQPKELLKEAQNEQAYDAIIVPGHPYNGESWTTTMNYRISWSVFLYKSGIAKNIIYSGSSVYTKYVEAKIMKEYAIALGVPAEHIFLDTNAEHSTENVYYSYKVAKKEGFKRIALATDPFQNNPLKRFMKKHQLPIDHLPAVFDTLGVPAKVEPLIDNTIAINKSFISLKEREGFFKRFSGTRGKNIIWNEEDLPNEELAQQYEKKGKLKRATLNAQVLYSFLFSADLGAVGKSYIHRNFQ